MSVGWGSVGTPGALPAFEEAHRRHGRLPWHVLVEPAIEWSRSGFPLGAAAKYYFSYLGAELLADDPDAFAAVLHPDGTAREVGETVVIPHLAGLPRAGRRRGLRRPVPRRGRPGVRRRYMAEHGGIVTQADLDAFTPVVRPSSLVDVGPTGRSPRTRHRRSAGRCSPRCSCCSTGTPATSGPTTTSSAGSPSSGPCCGTGRPSSTSPPTAPAPARPCWTASSPAARSGSASHPRPPM